MTRMIVVYTLILGMTQQDKCVEISRLCTVFNLRKASRAMTRMYDEDIASSGLRANQFTMLVALCRAAPAKISRLAEVLGADRSTLTRNLAPLERDGLIASTAGRDRRARVFTITQKGSAVLEKAIPLWEQAQRRAVEGLGYGRWRGFLDDLSAAAELARR